jgi:RIP metalloprotease RseP
MNPFEEVSAADEGRTYGENPFWKKSVVALVGVASHFVVAFIILYILVLGYGVTRSTTEVDAIHPVIAAPSGVEDEVRLVLRTSDEIVSIDGVTLDEWVGSESTSAARTRVGVLRDGELVVLETTDIVEPAPALLSGIAVGDRLVSLDGQPIEAWDDFERLVERLPTENVMIVVDRDGSPISFRTTLAAKPGRGDTAGYFGVSPTRIIEKVNPWVAAEAASAEIGHAAGGSVGALWALAANLDELVGAVLGQDAEVLDEVRPISAIGLVGAARGNSVEFALGLIAVVNVFVGIVNLVPLYPLDGGHFAVALYEKVRGRSADVRRLLPVAVGVFLFLATVGVLGIYFDIVDPLRLRK